MVSFAVFAGWVGSAGAGFAGVSAEATAGVESRGEDQGAREEAHAAPSGCKQRTAETAEKSRVRRGSQRNTGWPDRNSMLLKMRKSPSEGKRIDRQDPEAEVDRRVCDPVVGRVAVPSVDRVERAVAAVAAGAGRSEGGGDQKRSESLHGGEHYTRTRRAARRASHARKAERKRSDRRGCGQAHRLQFTRAMSEKQERQGRHTDILLEQAHVAGAQGGRGALRSSRSVDRRRRSR